MAPKKMGLQLNRSLDQILLTAIFSIKFNEFIDSLLWKNSNDAVTDGDKDDCGTVTGVAFFEGYSVTRNVSLVVLEILFGLVTVFREQLQICPHLVFSGDVVLAGVKQRNQTHRLTT